MKPILEEVDFALTKHTTNMMKEQTSDRELNDDAYRAHYVTATSEFTADRQREMEQLGQVGH